MFGESLVTIQAFSERREEKRAVSMGNVCCCFCKNKSSASTNNGDKLEKSVIEDIKAPSSDAASNSSTNNGDEPKENVFEDSKTLSTDVASSSSTNETLENLFDEIKVLMDAGNVDPKDVISHLKNLISNIEENKNPSSVESPTGVFYHMVDKISLKWQKIAKTGIPQELASFLEKVSTSNFILVGLSVTCSIFRRALEVPRNKESCKDFITNLKCLLAILHSHVSNSVNISADVIQNLANEIMKSIRACCNYANSGFGNRMLNADAVEAELKEASLQLSMTVQHLGLDAELKALYGIDQINRKLDHIPSIHVNVAEEELDKNTVGIEERVDKVKSLLLLENKDVRGRAVVLHGQGGMGKSTLARSVSRSAKPHGFTLASVCFDSERTDLETHKKELQSNILKQLTGNKIKPDDIKAGQSELRKVFSSKHCFVFIDNVVQCGQLTDFFPDHLTRDGNHSLRILVTSRDLDVRNYLPLHDEEMELYNVDRLDDVSSVVALRKYMDVVESAQEKFSEEFVKIERIAKLCYGTPILLSTIGRDLKCRRSKPLYYAAVIERLELSDFSKYDNLKLEDFILSVFNLLDQTTKAAFLDICKLMYRGRWEEVREIVGDTAMEELSDRLMIRKDVDSYGEWVMVHDLLRAMALRLVEKEKNRFLIELDDDVSGCFELSQLVGSDVNLSKIEALFINKRAKSYGILPTMFAKSHGILPTIYVEPEVFQRLRLLRIDGVRLEFRNEDAEYIPNKLEYLSVSRSHLGGVSQIFHWLKAEKSSPPLRTLKLSVCNDEFSGNVEKFVNLESLQLTYCRSLRELPSGISHLPRLRTIVLDGCSQLQCLPGDIGELSSFETLSMRGCRNLVALPDEVGKLPCLKELILQACYSLKTLPSSVAGLKALEELNLTHCEELRRLPEDIGELSSLKELRMEHCHRLETLPSSLAKLTSLESISMNGWSNMVTVPDFISNLYNLQKLYLIDCYNLKELPAYLEGFANMEVLWLKNCKALEILPDLGKMRSLKRINLAGCSKLQIIPPSIVELRHLHRLDIKNCTSIQNAADFIENMLQVFRNSGKDPSGFEYDAGILES